MRWRTRVRVCGGITLLACAAIAGSHLGATEDRVLPATGRGDVRFHLDAASFRGADDGLARVEFYLAIPNDQVEFREEEGDFRGRVKLELTVRDHEGNEAGRINREFPLSAGTLRRAGDRSVVQILAEEMSLAPGTYELRAEVEDLVGKKEGLWYRLRGERPHGVAEVALECPRFEPSPLDLSQIEFVRSVGAGAPGGHFSKGGLDLLPNPSRLYGLLLPELVAYVEVYGVPGEHPQEGGEWTTVYRILDSGGEEIFRQRKTGIQEVQGMWAKTIRLDLSRLRAGSYSLVTEIVDEQGHRLASRQGTFQVVWALYSWGKDPEEILEEMSVLLEPSELGRVQNMSRGELEAFLVSFWEERDPTPGTPANEVAREHFRRIVHANQHFGTGYVEGMLTDRGRVYVRFGEPDDMEEGYGDAFHLGPAERSISMISPPDQAGSMGDADTDRLLDQKMREGLQRALGAAGRRAEGKRYEIWYYDQRGESLRPDDRSVRRSTRLRFAFVDESGYGDYKLVYSSEPSEY